MYFSWMPFLIYFRPILAYDISLTYALIISVFNYVIYLIKSYIYAFYHLLGLSLAHITVRIHLLFIIKWVKIQYLIRSFT